MRTLTTAALGALVFLHTGAASAGQGDRFRYSCVSDDGYSVLIEAAKPRHDALLYRVNSASNAADACLTGSGKTEIQWDTFSQAPSELSKEDPNDILFHYETHLLMPVCVSDRPADISSPSGQQPGQPPHGPFWPPIWLGTAQSFRGPISGSTIEYGESCYHTIINDVRVDAANPLDSELITRDTNGQIDSRSPLHCSEGYSSQAATEIAAAARRNLAPPCTAAAAAELSRPIEEAGQKNIASSAVTRSPESASASLTPVH